MFPGCSAGEVSSSGLFSSGVRPGPDQTLVEDRENPEDTCQRYPSDAEIGITAEEADVAWYTTWWGQMGIAIAGLALTLFLAWALIPPVLMQYLIKSAKRLGLAPFKFWLGLPLLRGRKVLAGAAFVFVALCAVGVYQTMQSGFGRWDKWQESSDLEAFQFKPAQYIWGTQATKPLTNQQLKQLKMSCSCTGGSHRGLPGALSLIVASVLPRLVLLSTSVL